MICTLFVPTNKLQTPLGTDMVRSFGAYESGIYQNQHQSAMISQGLVPSLANNSVQNMPNISVVNVQVMDNPATFLSPITLKVSLDCSQPLLHHTEWKLAYVGSANDEGLDQVLGYSEVGPLEEGIVDFAFEARWPDASRIPLDELLKLTVVIFTASYGGAEFFRVGYYVHYQYPGLPQRFTLEQLDLRKAERHILSEKPRVTKTSIDWTQIQTKLSECGSSTLQESSKQSLTLVQEYSKSTDKFYNSNLI